LDSGLVLRFPQLGIPPHFMQRAMRGAPVMGDARSGPGRFVVMGCSALSMSPEALVFSFATRAFFYPSQQDCGAIADQPAALRDWLERLGRWSGD